MSAARPRPATIAAAVLLAAACRDTNLQPPPADVSGGLIVFASDRADANSELYIVAADGRGLRRLTSSRDANDRAPALSPDGRRIAWEREVTSTGGDVAAVEIWTMAVDGSGARAVVANGSFNRSPSWTPDGALVYASRITGSDQLWRVPADGGAPVRLTTGGAADQHPRVSPDGAWIVFQSNRGLDFDVYVMPGAGGDAVNLTASPGDDRFPAWSPDGRRIVWTRFDDATASFDLWAMRADGSEPRAVVATPFNELAPSVSPDGASVVFQSDRVPPARLFTVALGGGEPRALETPGGARSGSDQGAWWGRAP